MRLSIRKIYTFLFLLGIFFMPFNSFEGINELGEFKRESGAYFLILGFLLLCIDFLRTKKIPIPYKSTSYLILIIFMMWCILTIAFNFSEVADQFYKKTSGMNRFVRQYFVLVLSAVVFFLLYWNSILGRSVSAVLLMVRKAFLYSFIAVSIYGFFEILYLKFYSYPAYVVLRAFDYFPFTEYDQDVNNRISSVTWEAPALGTFLITSAGWMFSYILTSKSVYRYIPTIIVFVLTYFSGSRTALVVVLVQALVFFAIALNQRQKILAGLSIAGAAGIFAVVILTSDGGRIIYDMNQKLESLDFRGNLKSNISNQSRFGIQYANFVVFLENPIVGVGYGQQAYHAIFHYPRWSKKDNWEFKYMYLDKKNPMFPPGYNIYIRLLAETGIIGFLLFAYFLYYLMSRTWRMVKRSDGNTKAMSVILLVSFVGYAMNWLQMDTVRNYGFWICLAIFIKIQPTKNKVIEQQNSAYEPAD